MKCDYCQAEKKEEELQNFFDKKACSRCINFYENEKKHNSKLTQCPDCGKEYSKQVTYCPDCGKPPSKESKMIILPVYLLCFMFGTLGFHRFYTGKMISAILQILTLVITLFSLKEGNFIYLTIPILWVIVDIVTIIIGEFTDNDGKKIRKWV